MKGTKHAKQLKIKNGMKVSEEQFFIISRNKISKLNHQVSRLRNAQNTQINGG